MCIIFHIFYVGPHDRSSTTPTLISIRSFIFRALKLSLFLKISLKILFFFGPLPQDGGLDRRPGAHAVDSKRSLSVRRHSDYSLSAG